MKVVINRCYGGFGLTPEATKMAVEKGVPCSPYPYTPGKEDKKLVDLGDGWEIWGKRLGMFSSVVKDGKTYYLSSSDIEFRSHPALVSTVETLGEAAGGECAKLSIVDIPDGTKAFIDEYDGMEHVAQCHETWS